MKPLNLTSRRLQNLNQKQRSGYLRSKRKIYRLPPFDENRYKKLIENVFETNDFKRHVHEVKVKLQDFESDLIEEVIKFHIMKMAMEIIKVRPWKRTIYVHCWARIKVFPSCYNPYSVYYDQKLTAKEFRKYKKEIKQLFKTENNEQQN